MKILWQKREPLPTAADPDLWSVMGRGRTPRPRKPQPILAEVAARLGRTDAQTAELVQSRWHLRLLLRMAVWFNDRSGSRRWS